MGTTDDPGLLLIAEEMYLPLTTLEKGSRLKKAGGCYSSISQKSEAT